MLSTRYSPPEFSPSFALLVQGLWKLLCNMSEPQILKIFQGKLRAGSQSHEGGWKMIFLFICLMFRFHVNFPVCMVSYWKMLLFSPFLGLLQTPSETIKKPFENHDLFSNSRLWQGLQKRSIFWKKNYLKKKNIFGIYGCFSKIGVQYPQKKIIY